MGMRLRVFRDRRHARLLAAARAGDGLALQRLYRDLFDPVNHYVAVRLKRREDVEDLVATVFHRFLEHLEDYNRNRGSVLAWLLTITHNALVDHLREVKKSPLVGEVPETWLTAEENPFDHAARNEKARWVQAMLRELPPETRHMLALRFEQDLSYRDIAVCLGLSEVAVKQRFSRTLRSLKGRVQDRLKKREGELCRSQN